ncbi:MAG: cardiolipin synthase [Bacteroidales bacterium]|nr:cardiolipin synthase [Bacteroidales bacterium]
MNWSFWVALALLVAYIILLLGEISRLILENRNPVRTLAWIVVLITLPFIGIFLFYHLGLDYRKKKIFNLKSMYDMRWLQYMSEDQRELLKKQKILKGRRMATERKLMTLLLNNNKALLTLNNRMEVYNNGVDSFMSIFKAISSARNFIHLEFYIVEEGELASRLHSLLLAKLREGVEVRFIYDDVGSWSLSQNYVETLKKAGAEIYPFLPLMIHRKKANYRNHRKIVVVDGEMAFMGGVNVADRYVAGSNIGLWRDTLIRVEGEAVTSLQIIFLIDWLFVSGEMLINRDFYMPLPQTSGDSMAQVIASGPDSDWDSIHQAYVALVNMAEEYVYISTPYFMPGDVMLNALKSAAMSGVDVMLMLPAKSDTFITYWCSRSFVEELLNAHVKVFFFKPGINHSKVISVDGKLAAVGSANMDLRSLEQNFEVSMIIYDKQVVQVIEQDFIDDLTLCSEISLEKWSSRKRMDQVKESFCRLFTPIL